MSKPWLKKNNEKVIEVMGAKIWLKPLTFGEARKAIKEATRINMVTRQAEVDPSLLAVLRALYQIKDWELTDEEGNKLPITLETIDNVLDEHFVSEMIQKITELDNNGVTEDEKK